MTGDSAIHTFPRSSHSNTPDLEAIDQPSYMETQWIPSTRWGSVVHHVCPITNFSCSWSPKIFKKALRNFFYLGDFKSIIVLFFVAVMKTKHVLLRGTAISQFITSHASFIAHHAGVFLTPF